MTNTTCFTDSKLLLIGIFLLSVGREVAGASTK